MQRRPLARQIDARKLASSGAEMTALEDVKNFPRFVAGLYSDSGQVSISLRFFVDAQGFSRISGQVRTEVQGLCQRCLNPMSLVVDSGFEWVLVWTESQMQSLPKSVDPVILDSDELDVFSLVEDELIVSTPYISYHPEGECEASGPTKYQPDAEQEIKAERENPFAILEKLKSGD